MEIQFEGQKYRYLGQEPYVRRDGTKTLLSVWETPCADCGRVFRLRTTLLGGGGPARRCEEHRRARWSPRRKALTLKSRKGSHNKLKERRRQPAAQAPAQRRDQSHAICTAVAQALAAGHRFGEWRTIPSLFWIAPSDAWQVLREGKDRSQRVRLELAGRSEIETRYGTVQVEERGIGRWYFRLPVRDEWTELAARYPWLN